MLLTLSDYQITILLYVVDFRRPPNNNNALLLTWYSLQITILLYVVDFRRPPNNNITLCYWLYPTTK